MTEVSTVLGSGDDAITLTQVSDSSAVLVPAPSVSLMLAPVMATFIDASGLSWTASISTILKYGSLNLNVVPDVLLSANLPDGIRGYPYTGTISATNIGGASGDITITVDSLPAGLTLGATTTTDHQTYTATITGTLQ